MFYLKGGAKNTNNQWTTLIHNGPLFPDEYQKHNIHVIINNKKIILKKEAEEYATAYAKYLETDYVSNPRFNQNFWKDYSKLILDIIREEKINNISEIDFSLIQEHLKKEREDRLNKTKEEKEREKKKRLILEEPYMLCYIDGQQQKVGNYRIEPPGIFLGRGNHPKIGRIKRRINPEDVIINIGKDAPIPKPNVGGNWKDIINDRTKIWLASWLDDITGKTKYVFTSVESLFKEKSDIDKFDLARKLKNKVKQIREDYNNKILNNDMKDKQLGLAVYFIDKLALRVGTKKDKKETADTVGVSSLRVEHIFLLENNYIKLDFLGKDSVRYCQKVQVEPDIYKNLEIIYANKNKKEDLLDKINSNDINQYLNSFMNGLTAKVWRTFNASYLLQKLLDKINEDKLKNLEENERINYLLGLFHQANTEVAILCNHQKNVSTNLESGIDKINDQIKNLQKKKNKLQSSNTKDKTAKISKLNNKIKLLKLKRDTKIKMKNVSLGTSKTNYIDPRIVFSFMKKYNIPEDKLFTKTLLDRFKWATDVDSKWRF